MIRGGAGHVTCPLTVLVLYLRCIHPLGPLGDTKREKGSAWRARRAQERRCFADRGFQLRCGAGRAGDREKAPQILNYVSGLGFERPSSSYVLVKATYS